MCTRITRYYSDRLLGSVKPAFIAACAIGVGALAIALFVFGHRKTAPLPLAPHPLVTTKAQAGISAPAPESDDYAEPNFPYHWGTYTITCTNINEDDSPEQCVRLLDQSDRTLWQADDISIDAVKFVHILSASSPDLEIDTSSGGNMGYGTEYFFTYSGGLHLLFTNKDPDTFTLDSTEPNIASGRPNLICSYYLPFFDALDHPGGGIFYCVYVWNGSKYVNESSKFPQQAIHQGTQSLNAYEKNLSQHPRADFDASDSDDAADRADAINYWANYMAIGQGDDAQTWLLQHAGPKLRSHLLSIEPDIRKAVPLEDSELDVTMGDGKILDKSSSQIISAVAVAGDRQILPGEKLGKISLGESRSAVDKELGAPATKYNLNNGVSEEAWKSGNNDDISMVALYKGDVVIQIESAIPSMTTGNGLSVRSQIKAFFQSDKSFQSSSYSSSDAVIDYYDDVNAGIALVQGVQDFPDDLSDARSWLSTNTPDRIIIHQRAEKVMPSSMAYISDDQSETDTQNHRTLKPTATQPTLHASFLYKALKS